MEHGLRDCCRSIRIGKILIRSDDDTSVAKVFYAKFPSDIHKRRVLLMYPILSKFVKTCLQEGDGLVWWPLVGAGFCLRWSVPETPTGTRDPVTITGKNSDHLPISFHRLSIKDDICCLYQ